MNINEPSTSQSVENPKKELQSMWKVPAIAAIVSIFHVRLNLPHLEIETLEDKLLKKSLIGSLLLNELIVALLKGIFPGRRMAAVAEWYRYRTVACFVTGSSPVPLKTRRVGQRCTLNLSRAETSSRWCGVEVRRGGASSGVVHVT
ncbi:uncharacterized protein TNCV_4014821 [Trichonephila clavipes]|uniref:Uncharacterized protein n=1 Tax=Trichonephila clavipes TaxID=2585209 RepID=A0A8X6RD99_TRICX|nr:uncharacterized protein TNCV_4014821 [Trichonephila clavipes]